MRVARRIFVFVVCWLISFSAEASNPSKNRRSFEVSFGAETSLERFNHDLFLRTEIWTNLHLSTPLLSCWISKPDNCSSGTDIDLRFPLRLRLVDGRPLSSSGCRREDWDDLEDLGRFLRRIQSGRPSKTSFGRIGELGFVTLGHGTVVRDYLNQMGPTNRQLGGLLKETYYGISAIWFVDDMTHPSLTGGRLSFEPGAFSGDDRRFFEFGATFLSDFRAPISMAEPYEKGRIPILKKPEIEESRALTIIGLDLEARIWRAGPTKVTMYSDLNKHLQFGTGVHVGSTAEFDLKPELKLTVKGEYRRGFGRYLPEYVGSNYELTRNQFLGWGQTRSSPKLQSLANLDKGGFSGGMGEVGFVFDGWVETKLRFADSSGEENADLWLYSRGRLTSDLRLGLFYSASNIGSFSDVSKANQALISTEVQVPLFDALYLTGGYRHLWHYENRTRHRHLHEGFVGVGTGWGFTDTE